MAGTFKFKVNEQPHTNTQPKAEVRFDNQRKHSGGPPELVIPWPAEKLTIEELYDRAVDVLEEHQAEVEMLLQPLCEEGAAYFGCVDFVTRTQLRIYATEEVYRGCRDLNGSCDLVVDLNSTLDAEGIHFFVPVNARIYSDE